MTAGAAPSLWPPRPLPALAAAVLLGLIGIALCLLLWPQWRLNPDLSHGFFMPVVFIVLLREARRGTLRHLPPGAAAVSLLLFLLTLGLLALFVGGLYAASVDWSNAVILFLLTAAFVCLLAAGLSVFASASLRFVPLNWSTACAAGLWLMAAPIPPGTYTTLTIKLQTLVTAAVLDTLHLFGIAATREGNVINLATTAVGVEEACSGVRSLVSCLFVGVLFSSTLVRRPLARALLIGLAAPLALAMNFLRSLTLTLLANSGIDISGTWHDLTGFAVLGVTAALLATLALRLETRAVAAPAAAPAPATSPRLGRLLYPLIGGLLIASAMVGFFYANTRPSVRQNVPVPSLLAILPAQAPGWEVRTSTDLYQFSSTLQTDHLVERTYQRMTPAGPLRVTVYLAYWRAGQAPVSLVASHTPDACWPGSGWEPVPIAQTRASLSLGDRVLPVAEARLFRGGSQTEHIWFWHVFDGRPLDFRDPYSASELLRFAWRYGFRRDGDQLFIRVSSNRPWEEIAGEPLLSGIIGALSPLGLRDSPP